MLVWVSGLVAGTHGMCAGRNVGEAEGLISKALRAFYDFSTRKTDYSFLYMLLYSVQISIMFFLSFFVFFSFLQICLTQLVWEFIESKVSDTVSILCMSCSFLLTR